MIEFYQSIQDLPGINISLKDITFLLKDLKVGQILRSKVVENIAENEILLLLNGLKIKAETVLNLAEGDVLFLKVQSLKPNLILQLYGLESSSDSETGKDVLRVLNMNQDNLLGLIVKAQIKYKLPINKTEITNILNVFKEIFPAILSLEKDPNTNKEILQLLKNIKSQNIFINEENVINSISFLKSNSIPVIPRTVLMVIEYLKIKQDIGSDLQSLKQLLESNIAIPKNFSNNISRLFSEGFNLKNIVQNLGIDYEKRVFDFLKNKDKNGIIDHLSLKRLLLELREFLSENPNVDRSERLQLLSSRILNNIEIQQLLNNNDSGSGKQWYLNIPFPIGNTFKSVELKINARNDKNIQYSNKISDFNLKVEMTKLGTVNTSGNLFNQLLSLSFNLENKNIIDKFESDFDSLKQNMSNLGYSVSSIRCEVFPQNTESLNISFLKENEQTIIDRRA